MLNPCEPCLIKAICEKMCPKVIEFYKPQVKKRCKKEIEDATGYIWHDDPDGHNFFTGSMLECPVKEKYHPNMRITTFKKVSIIRGFINYVKKGLKLCQKNKNTLKD